MKKGVSLMVLAITIVVMVILGTVIIMRASSPYNDTSKMKLQADISQLEYLMSIYKTRKNGNIDFDTVKFNTASLHVNEIEQFKNETIVGDSILLYIIDLSKIDAQAVNYGNLKLGSKDRYLYSLKTGKVYYELGVEVDGITYYYIEDGEG